MSERVHCQQWCCAGGVAEVVGEWATCHCGAGGRLDGHNLDICAVDFVGDEGEGKPREVGTAARAADDDIDVLFACEFELLFGFEADDCLMEHNVV